MFGYDPSYSTNASLPETTHPATQGILRHLFISRQVAIKNALDNSEKYRQRHDDKVQQKVEKQKITAGNFVFLDRRLFLGTNAK